MTDTVLCIDPGQVTGWSLWSVDDDLPMTRLEYGLVKGGLKGWIAWMTSRIAQYRPDYVVVERYIPEEKSVEIEPLLIEGALFAICDALGLPEPERNLRSEKSQVRDEILRRAGLWILPSEARIDPNLYWSNADDVHDSYRHALIWARKHDHLPTLEAFYPDE